MKKGKLVPRKNFKAGAVLSPLPVVMVSCGDMRKNNIITIAWTGIVNSDPPMTYISVRKERYSYDIIKNTGEFVINLVNNKLAYAADWCGVKSGRDFDKWNEQHLTAVPSKEVSCPSIAQSPLSLECRVAEIKSLGSHDMFIANIVNISADEDLIDKNGSIRLDRAGLIAYNHGHYFPLQREETGRFGYSVMKPKTRRRYEAMKRPSKGRKRHRNGGKK